MLSKEAIEQYLEAGRPLCNIVQRVTLRSPKIRPTAKRWGGDAVLWVYVLAVVAATIAGMHYVRGIGEQESRSQTWLRRATHSAACLAIGLFFALIIGGLLAAPWWWPSIALVVGVVANVVLEESHLSKPAPSWILPFAGASAWLTAFLAYLHVTPS